MHGELPEFTRCCFCIPLRRGLIGWGYIRLVVNILNIISMICSWIYIYSRHNVTTYTIVLLVMVVALTIDSGFSVLLIVSGHMKSAKIMRVSYIYGIVGFGIVVAFSIFVIAVQARYMIIIAGYIPVHYLVIDIMLSLGIIAIGIFVQGYVVLLTRSEMIKLQNQSLEMEFSNHAADGEARCVRAERKDDAMTVVDISEATIDRPLKI